MTKAYIGLGANLGDPPAQLRRALQAIAALPEVRLLAQSRLYRSDAIGVANQPDYCNAACMIETQLAPEPLFEHLVAIERAAGRVRDGTRWGPRLLDLDLLHYAGVTCDTPRLRLPHAELARRNFVLVPLLEIAPGLDIPDLGPIAGLAEAAGGAGLSLWPAKSG
ncbi:MAG: 2-amino-4-hydroxy-6-hydroxymethyldihydropteridine diphosphokinase [Stenotrophobium sp.]